MDKVEDDKISLTHSHLHKHTQKVHKQTKKNFDVVSTEIGLQEIFKSWSKNTPQTKKKH